MSFPVRIFALPMSVSTIHFNQRRTKPGLLVTSLNVSKRKVDSFLSSYDEIFETFLLDDHLNGCRHISCGRQLSMIRVNRIEVIVFVYFILPQVGYSFNIKTQQEILLPEPRD